MKKYLVIIIIALLSSVRIFAQSSELFPRYTVVDVAPKVTGDKSLEQLQTEFQEQADKSHNISTVSHWMTNKVQPSEERYLDVDVKYLLVLSK
jgi:hypothetical protein